MIRRGIRLLLGAIDRVVERSRADEEARFMARQLVNRPPWSWDRTTAYGRIRFTANRPAPRPLDNAFGHFERWEIESEHPGTWILRPPLAVRSGLMVEPTIRIRADRYDDVIEIAQALELKWLLGICIDTWQKPEE